MKSFHENGTTFRPYHPEKKNSTPLFNNAPLSNSAPGVGPEKNNSTPGVAIREFTGIRFFVAPKLFLKRHALAFPDFIPDFDGALRRSGVHAEE